MVVSYKNTLHGPCLVIPTTTEPQGSSPWACKLAAHVDGQSNWAICNHPYTVAPSRLSQVRQKIPRVSDAEFNDILKRLMAWLPRPFDIV